MAMTSPADAVLRAILAEPDCDDHRLVYADLLEDCGDEARAEFIRLQILIENAKTDCWCGSCVKRRGGGQHHN